MRSRSSTSTTTGPCVALVFIFAEALEAEQQPRHAEGEAGRRHPLAGEARDQVVIAPAAATEPNRIGWPFSSLVGAVSSASNTGPV